MTGSCSESSSTAGWTRLNPSVRAACCDTVGEPDNSSLKQTIQSQSWRRVESGGERLARCLAPRPLCRLAVMPMNKIYVDDRVRFGPADAGLAGVVTGFIPMADTELLIVELDEPTRHAEILATFAVIGRVSNEP